MAQHWFYEPGSNRMVRPTGDPITRAASAASPDTGAQQSKFSGFGPAAIWGARGDKMKLPSTMLLNKAYQSRGLTTPYNPIADVPNWNTGGRHTSAAAQTGGVGGGSALDVYRCRSGSCLSSAEGEKMKTEYRPTSNQQFNTKGLEAWVADKLNIKTGGETGIGRQRCLEVGGQKLACVEDKMKIGPGLWVLGGLALFLLVRR